MFKLAPIKGSRILQNKLVYHLSKQIRGVWRGQDSQVQITRTWPEEYLKEERKDHRLYPCVPIWPDNPGSEPLALALTDYSTQERKENHLNPCVPFWPVHWCPIHVVERYHRWGCTRDWRDLARKPTRRQSLRNTYLHHKVVSSLRTVTWNKCKWLDESEGELKGR